MTSNSLPQATIQCAVFKGKDRDVFIDRKEYDGDIVAQLDAAYEYVLRNINMGSEINGFYRTDIYELPTDCIREMICNAVAHRSYLHPSSIQGADMDDRVEVTSPGMLFGSLSWWKLPEAFVSIYSGILIRRGLEKVRIKRWRARKKYGKVRIK